MCIKLSVFLMFFLLKCFIFKSEENGTARELSFKFFEEFRLKPNILSMRISPFQEKPGGHFQFVCSCHITTFRAIERFKKKNSMIEH